jgi:1,4-alpha-glucan branching enzyme
MRLDEALKERDPAPGERSGNRFAMGSWGQSGDLSTWSGPAVAEIAFAARAAELQLLASRPPANSDAVRELLALQASDWAFMVSRGLASPYALERAAGHRKAIEGMLAGEPIEAGALRNLGVYADPALALAP